jgi:hypothetical protein
VVDPSCNTEHIVAQVPASSYTKSTLINSYYFVSFCSNYCISCCLSASDTEVTSLSGIQITESQMSQRAYILQNGKRDQWWEVVGLWRGNNHLLTEQWVDYETQQQDSLPVSGSRVASFDQGLLFG